MCERPEGIAFDLTASLALAIPGTTWKETKEAIVAGGISLHQEMRWRCMRDLILACATLERYRIIHGDLSDNNVMVDVNVSEGGAALQLIDFDAFVSARSGAPPPVTIGEGGTYGTDGYCPPDLRGRAQQGNPSVAPYSDRYGRDMLLLELMCFDARLSRGRLPPDEPPCQWPQDVLVSLYERAWFCLPKDLVGALRHLRPPGVFGIAERQRPSANAMAGGVERLKRRRAREARRKVQKLFTGKALPRVAGAHEKQNRTGHFSRWILLGVLVAIALLVLVGLAARVLWR
jgi:serine/threonine protein kinase